MCSQGEIKYFQGVIMYFQGAIMDSQGVIINSHIVIIRFQGVIEVSHSHCFCFIPKGLTWIPNVQSSVP